MVLSLIYVTLPGTEALSSECEEKACIIYMDNVKIMQHWLVFWKIFAGAFAFYNAF